MNILITGAFGFVGTNLSAYLVSKGHELWALDVGDAVGSRQSAVGSTERAHGGTERTLTANEANRANGAGRGAYVRCFGWEELDDIPWGEADAVIHLAGKAHDTRNTSDAQSYFDINVGLTKRVLERFLTANQTNGGNGGTGCSHGGAKAQRAFILFSSVKAVADQVEGVLTEEEVPNPQTPYGQSKLEAEGLVQSAVGSWQSAGRYYVLRPCMIHGPGNKGNLNLLYTVVRRGIPWPLGAFENRRSFASVGNVCAVVEGLLKGDAPSGIYQVADDASLSTNELIGLMAQALGRRVKIWRVPAGWVRAVARAGDALRLPLNSERLKKLTESYIVSNSKIKKALGWAVMPVSAQEGMRKTLESFGASSLTEARSSQRPND